MKKLNEEISKEDMRFNFKNRMVIIVKTELEILTHGTLEEIKNYGK